MKSELDIDLLDLQGPLASSPPHDNDFYPGNFNILQAAFNWCQEWAAPHGYARRKNQLKKKYDHTIRQYSKCDRSGEYVVTKVSNEHRQRLGIDTQKTQCPFRCMGKLQPDGRWGTFTAEDRGTRNHER